MGRFCPIWVFEAYGRPLYPDVVSRWMHVHGHKGTAGHTRNLPPVIRIQFNPYIGTSDPSPSTSVFKPHPPGACCTSSTNSVSCEFPVPPSCATVGVAGVFDVPS